MIVYIILTKLKFCVLRGARERDHVADVGHTCYKEQQSLEAKAEAAVRHCSVPAGNSLFEGGCTVDAYSKFSLYLHLEI